MCPVALPDGGSDHGDDAPERGQPSDYRQPRPPQQYHVRGRDIGPISSPEDIDEHDYEWGL